MLKVLTPADKESLEGWMQEYLAEISQYYSDSPDKNGRNSYPYLPLYFQDADRYAFAVLKGTETIGFALVNHVALAIEQTDHSLAEFCIFKPYRGRGLAKAAMEELLQTLPGTWQLKFAQGNKRGAMLWRRIQAQYGGKSVELPDNEVLLVFDTKAHL